MPAARLPEALSRNSPKPEPARIWTLSQPPFDGFQPTDNSGYLKSDANTAIVIDMGKERLG
jgi:actin-related protein 5